MEFKEMGNPSRKTLMLLPGTGCAWQSNFKNVIEPLGEHFRLICVNYDGFDGNKDVVFPSMVEVTAKIEEYIQQRHGGKLDGAYGSSLGGSFVGLLIQRKNVHIDHGFIGSSDLDQGNIQVDGTKVHVIYALKMGKKYEQRYLKHFHNPDIRPFDMQHEGWIFEKKWSKPVLETIIQCMEG